MLGSGLADFDVNTLKKVILDGIFSQWWWIDAVRITNKIYT